MFIQSDDEIHQHSTNHSNRSEDRKSKTGATKEQWTNRICRWALLLWFDLVKFLRLWNVSFVLFIDVCFVHQSVMFFHIIKHKIDIITMLNHIFFAQCIHHIHCCAHTEKNNRLKTIWNVSFSSDSMIHIWRWNFQRKN